MDDTILTAAVFGSAALALAVWWLVVRRAARRVTVQARREAARTLEDADRQAEAKLREAELAAREKLLHARSEFEKVIRKRRTELDEIERQQRQRQDGQEKLERELEQKGQELEHRTTKTGELEKLLASQREELDRLVAEERSRLEKIAGLTSSQAREELVRLMEKDARLSAAHLVKRIEDEAREKATDEARKILATAIQKNASDYVAESTVSVVMLPSDDMKGRIIGREGRNIRALEMNTGVDLIVDDTPEAVILSGFDPYRREIARVALEQLIADGRIHPARIEEVVEKVKAEFEEHIRKEGESVLLELDVGDVHPELVALLGRLRYRTSYGQSVLRHSQEVAFLAGTMAAELRSDVRVAKRAGIFHDIGKSLDREKDGSHLEIGIELLRRYGESENVVHAMACHHGDYEPQSVEAVLVTAADALSAARPGARREVLESYVKRLERLEELARSFEGVRKCYAIQAGREIRIIVDSGQISDEEVIWLGKDVAKKIESELSYPGQIKVTVIRETRSVEYAR